MQHSGLPQEDRQNWPRQYKTLEEVLTVPANNITHSAGAGDGPGGAHAIGAKRVR